MSLLSRYNE